MLYGIYILPVVGILLASNWENPEGTELVFLFLILSMSQGSGFILLSVTILSMPGKSSTKFRSIKPKCFGTLLRKMVLVVNSNISTFNIWYSL